MKKVIFGLMSAALISASGCRIFGEEVYRFYYKNNADSLISFSYSLLYPDTSISHIQRFEISGVSPKEVSSNDTWEKDWTDVINQDIPGKKLQVFVFSVVVTDANWAQVRDGYLVKKRYEITADQLKAMNYTIAYP